MADPTKTKVNLGCGTHYAKGWHNLDAVSNDQVQPDEVIDPADPFVTCPPIQRLMLSHVLEHVEWNEVMDLLEKCYAALADGGEVMCVGPDYKRTIKGWHEGRLGWDLVESVIDHSFERRDSESGWPNARHHWSCHYDRVKMLFDSLEWSELRELSPTNSKNFTGWPVVGMAEWQFAIYARK